MKQISNETLVELTTALNETVNTVFERYKPEFISTYVDWNQSISDISLGYGEDEESKDVFLNAAWELMSTVMHSVFTLYGFEAEESSGEEQADASVKAQEEVVADFDAIGVVVCFQTSNTHPKSSIC